MSVLITFRAYGPGGEGVVARADGKPLGSVAQRDLERYYHLLATELATVELTEAEASLIVDAMNGTLMEPQTMRLLWAEIDDAIRLEGLDRKWDVDGPALVAKLRSLSYAQTAAIVDACERFWSDTSVPLDEQLRRMGLVKSQKGKEE